MTPRFELGTLRASTESSTTELSHLLRDLPWIPDLQLVAELLLPIGMQEDFNLAVDAVVRAALQLGLLLLLEAAGVATNVARAVEGRHAPIVTSAS